MYEKQYITKLSNLLEYGERIEGRNGAVRKMFGLDLTFDTQHMPLLTSRRIFWKGVAGEYAAFLRGPESVQDFEDWGCNYWKSWADDDGALRVDYGNAWLKPVNQVDGVINGLKYDPHGRRHLIDSWNPGNLGDLSLPCCHYSYQFYVRENTYVDLLWNQRSADWCVGVPADAILAAIMLHTFAHVAGYKPGIVKMSFGDAHVYENHVENAHKLIANYVNIEGPIKPVEWTVLRRSRIYDFEPQDVRILSDYEPTETIKFDLSV